MPGPEIIAGDVWTPGGKKAAVTDRIACAWDCFRLEGFPGLWRYLQLWND